MPTIKIKPQNEFVEPRITKPCCDGFASWIEDKNFRFQYGKITLPYKEWGETYGCEIFFCPWCGEKIEVIQVPGNHWWGHEEEGQ